MVSETPATARLSHVGHRRAPTLSNQIAGKDGQTCRGLGGSGLLLPASWEVTGIRTCWRGGGGGGGSSSRARHTYLHSLGAHAAPRAAPPAETRPGPAGAAAAASQRRRALGHLAAKFRPRRSPRRLAPRPPDPARPPPDARSPRALRAPAPGAAEARAGRCPPPCAARGSSAPRAAGPGGRGAERGPGGGVRASRSRAAAAAARRDAGSAPRPAAALPLPSPRCVNPPTTNPSTCAPPPPRRTSTSCSPAGATVEGTVGGRGNGDAGVRGAESPSGLSGACWAGVGPAPATEPGALRASQPLVCVCLCLRKRGRRGRLGTEDE